MRFEQEEHRLSPDSVDGPILANEKKDKTCLVCGDKALGYNFNAVSCESCKAFFRRNAHKTIRGRCEGKCDINVESRSFCKRCRLAKCFTIGMRKDMILDDDQKKLRKQKILINKLRRHGTLPPEDTYAVSDNDIKFTYGMKYSPAMMESLRTQYPHLSDNELHVLAGTEPEPRTLNRKKDESDKYIPWCDIQESLHDIIVDMEPSYKTILLEMNKAHEGSAFLSSTSTRLQNLPTSPTEVFNIADGFVRRIIKVAKQLEFFRAIEKDDQIALLKGSVVEIMMLRSAVNFDLKTETWNLSTASCIHRDNKDSASNSSGSRPSSTSSSADLGSPSPGFDRRKSIDREGNTGLNIQQLREAAMKGADLNTLRNMASKQDGSKLQLNNTSVLPGVFEGQASLSPKDDASGLQDLRNAASSAGLNIDMLRKAAMSGASFEQLSQMARGGGALAAGSPQSASNQPPAGPSNTISSDILKFGNSETKSMFLTYSKFIRSLMGTIYGDLIVLKFLIMLSLFSPDRQGVKNRDLVESYQQIYAETLRKYLDVRFVNEKNIFARCIMKLTDLRNVNEVHTKMLLKMHVEDIEPLLVEIFDLPQ